MKIDGTQGLSDAQKPYCVFISHNRANKATAREIGIFLIAEDINVWFDEWQIFYGESIPRSVEIGLKSCTHFYFFGQKMPQKHHGFNTNWSPHYTANYQIETVTSKLSQYY